MRVDDTRHRPRGCFGCGNNTRVHAVGQAVDDIAGDLVADMADECGDHEPGYRVAPGLSGSYGDQADERPGRGEGVQPGMPGIGDERGGSDALADDQFVPGDDLVADDADDCPGDTRADVGGVTVLDEFADALIPGEGGAGPDDHGDPDAGQVL